MKILLSVLTIATFAALSSITLADNKTAAPAPPAAPQPVLFELAKIKGADVEIKEDPQAMDGEYVMNKQSYNPVAFITTPPGDDLTVWAHVRGSSYQLKAILGGAQQELDWIWGAPGPFVWKKFGTYPRAKLGEQFLIIRGATADDTDGIDAVLVSPDPSFSPDTAKDLQKFLTH